MRGEAQDVHGAPLDLCHEQHVQAMEQHGIDMQNVAGKDAGCLRSQKLPPGISS
jgi:hypothetical protein